MLRKEISTKRKYELTNVSIQCGSSKLHQIKALRSLRHADKGSLGGYIESEDNLSHDGDCWICENAMVFENARVSGLALVSGDARVYGNAHVSKDASVHGTARVSGNAHVSDDAWVYGGAWVSGDAYVCGTIDVCGDTKLNHGCWNKYIVIDGREYLISVTLEKLELI